MLGDVRAGHRLHSPGQGRAIRHDLEHRQADNDDHRRAGQEEPPPSAAHAHTSPVVWMNPSNAWIPPTLPFLGWIRRGGSDWLGRTVGGGSWDITAALPGRSERFVSKRIRVSVFQRN